MMGPELTPWSRVTQIIRPSRVIRFNLTSLPKTICDTSDSHINKSVLYLTIIHFLLQCEKGGSQHFHGGISFILRDEYADRGAYGYKSKDVDIAACKRLCNSLNHSGCS